MRREQGLGLGGFLIATALFAVAVPAAADFSVDEDEKLTLQADFRLRYESDWDSQRANGTPRNDRQRLRIRARVGFTWDPNSALRFGLRARTGSRDSQQSPHITIHDFDDNPEGDKDFLLDKYYLRGKSGDAWAWLGRNTFGSAFFRQNELFWDDDVTIAGLALGWQAKAGDATLKLNGGYFRLPDGGVDFNGDMGAGQLVYRQKHGAIDWTVAGGGFRMRGQDGAENLRRGNGARDYMVWAINTEAKTRLKDRKFRIGLDVYYNSEDYSDAEDEFTLANQDEKTGVVFSARWGDTWKEKWLVGYYFSYIQTLAVNASYAQDDWIRWGSPTQTDSSDLKGHELRFGWSPIKNMGIIARLYLVDAITSVQDGKRFRIDFNYKL